ncbi:hypothetical protein EDB92DRAFT_1942502 [Lactarius akahatsu]|uniref:BTB domain-containing protein n=1 Tax=Lactarius akahatsu TaxID=416441 RepID=A0AAD4LQQ4_9AGAM|nr:hypothetical protein EDB92DRAFT_1942502 [Lactarius akahatsu]
MSHFNGTLYCVHRYFFSRDSVYFSTRFAQLGIRDHEALSTIISIGDIKRNDFEALLSVLFYVSFVRSQNFEAHELTYEQWKSVLHLSTRWGFASLRELTLKSIKPPTSHDQFVLARTYSINHWVLPALTSLCERTLSLSLDEARQMKMEDVILVATVREEIRGGAVRVNAVEIPGHVAKIQQANLEAKADLEARAETEANANEAEEKAKLVTAAQAKAEADAKAKLKAEAKARRKAEFMAKREAKAKAEAGAKEKEAGASADVPDEAKSETAVATTDKHVNTNATDASNASEAATTVPNSPGDKSADFAPVSSEAESKQAHKTTPEEVVPSSEPNKDSVPASTVPPAPTKATPAPSVSENGPAPERDAPVAKERTPTSEPAASAPSKPNSEPEAPNAPDADAKKASEAPAQTESPLAAQGGGEKPDGAATEPALQPSQTGEAVGEKPAAKGDDAKPEGPVKPALCPDHFHEASAAPTMSASSPRTSVDEALLPSLEKEDDDEASRAWFQLSKNQRKRLRDKARKQARMSAENQLRPPSRTTSNSVDNSVVQEHKPVTSAASIGTLAGGRDGPVDVKTESGGDDDAPVIVEKPDAVATPVEMAVDDDEWDW